MRLLPALAPWLRIPRPLSAGTTRVVGEAILGYVVLLGAAAWTRFTFHTALAATAILLLDWAWLILWPAWRLRPLRRRPWWRRLGVGMGRALLLGFGLGLVGGIIAGRVGPPFSGLLGLDMRVVPPSIVAFTTARVVVIMAAAVGRRARRRLRWQLMTSHLAVILLTFVGLAAVGSVIAANLLLSALQPNPREEASALAAAIAPRRPATSVDVQVATRVIEQITARHLWLHLSGESPLAILGIRPPLDLSVALMSMEGRVLATAAGSDAAPRNTPTVGTSRLPAATWQALRRAALAGRAAVAPLPWTYQRSRETIGAAPVLDSRGRPVAIALVQSAHIDLTPDNVLVVTLALFGVATVTLVSATLTVTLGLSGLFGYLFARGLTRRLEAVSRAAAAIAAGDLSRRVPVKAQNEVGQLAANFNQMVAHLEETMGEVQRARTQAVDALRARQELVASISHELRTPLAIVRAHLDTLVLRHSLSAAGGTATAPVSREEEDIAVPAATLRALGNEMDRLAALVDDLFALSRAETGAVHVHCAPTDVGALVSEVATLMRPLAQSDGKIALSVEVPPGLPLALADGDRLRQILANLVRNAVRHTPEGGIIVLSVAADGPWIVVAVADTGEGIPAEHLAHIFDRFYRVDQARTRTSGGAGLGLAIVREFVEMMGGHVAVESTPGEGSCFRVFLPKHS